MPCTTLDYQTLMRQGGFRVTPQRQWILDVICESGGHSTPDEFFERVQAKSPVINQATIYRILDFLCEMRFVVAAQIGRQMYYENAGATPHHRLVCRRCNKVEQIGPDMVKTFFAKLEGEYRFEVDMDHLTLFGLCRKCRRATKVKSG